MARARQPKKALGPPQHSYESLKRLTVKVLRKHARDDGIPSITYNKAKKEELIRCLCSSWQIPLPEDDEIESIPSPSPSPVPLSVRRKAPVFKHSAGRAVDVPEAGPSNMVLKEEYPARHVPAGRANPLDTHRAPKPPPPVEARDIPPANWMNQPPLDSTPEPEAPLPALPADAASLAQTVAMLAEARRRNDEMELQIKQLSTISETIVGKVSQLKAALQAEKARNARAQAWLTNYQAEAPTFGHDEIFPPEAAVLVLQENATETLREIDATVADSDEVATALKDPKNKAVYDEVNQAKIDKGKNKQKAAESDAAEDEELARVDDLLRSNTADLHSGELAPSSSSSTKDPYVPIIKKNKRTSDHLERETEESSSKRRRISHPSSARPSVGSGHEQRRENAEAGNSTQRQTAQRALNAPSADGNTIVYVGGVPPEDAPRAVQPVWRRNTGALRRNETMINIPPSAANTVPRRPVHPSRILRRHDTRIEDLLGPNPPPL